jgi:hypothetical protein
MAYQFTRSTILPATPQAIYRAWLDTRLDSGMTGGAAIMSGHAARRFGLRRIHFSHQYRTHAG